MGRRRPIRQVGELSPRDCERGGSASSRERGADIRSPARQAKREADVRSPAGQTIPVEADRRGKATGPLPPVPRGLAPHPHGGGEPRRLVVERGSALREDSHHRRRRGGAHRRRHPAVPAPGRQQGCRRDGHGNGRRPRIRGDHRRRAAWRHDPTRGGHTSADRVVRGSHSSSGQSAHVLRCAHRRRGRNSDGHPGQDIRLRQPRPGPEGHLGDLPLRREPHARMRFRRAQRGLLQASYRLRGHRPRRHGSGASSHPLRRRRDRFARLLLGRASGHAGLDPGRVRHGLPLGNRGVAYVLGRAVRRVVRRLPSGRASLLSHAQRAPSDRRRRAVGAPRLARRRPRRNPRRLRPSPERAIKRVRGPERERNRGHFGRRRPFQRPLELARKGRAPRSSAHRGRGRGAERRSHRQTPFRGARCDHARDFASLRDPAARRDGARGLFAPRSCNHRRRRARRQPARLKPPGPHRL